VLASPVDPVIVVTGHQEDRVREALSGRKVRFVHNSDYASGLSGSVKAGIAALSDDPDVIVDGAVVCLGDMPAVTADHIRRLIAAFDPVEGRAICVPTCAGKRGNPVLWGAQLFPPIQSLSGDVGAKHLIGENEELVCEVALDDEAIFADIDTEQALADFTSSQKAKS
jgi:molybdenum cofactor cytidylyltransferase